MPSYFARVELHGNATYAQYERLHVAMANRGFQRTIRNFNGTTLNLPMATYYKENSTFSVSQENEAIRLAANSVQLNNSIVVIQSAGWNGYLS